MFISSKCANIFAQDKKMMSSFGLGGSTSFQRSHFSVTLFQRLKDKGKVCLVVSFRDASLTT